MSELPVEKCNHQCKCKNICQCVENLAVLRINPKKIQIIRGCKYWPDNSCAYYRPLPACLFF